jgi:hypothetical protein
MKGLTEKFKLVVNFAHKRVNRKEGWRRTTNKDVFLFWNTATWDTKQYDAKIGEFSLFIFITSMTNCFLDRCVFVALHVFFQVLSSADKLTCR